jgi:hypothetical protein
MNNRELSELVKDELEVYAREALGLRKSDVLRFEPILRGGSDRAFFRITSGGYSAILMRYGTGRPENALYAGIGEFLLDIGVAVPRIFRHDPARRVIVMEDMGDRDLFTLRDDDPALRMRYYRLALGEIARLHAFPLDSFPGEAVPLMEGFGPALYRWEREYFRENFLRGVCGTVLPAAEEDLLEKELAELADRLSRAGSCLVHRDFQSQNIMLRRNGVALIDFQGMRRGTAHYDLGSLLFDPYASLAEEERAELLLFYYDTVRPPVGWEDFRRSFLDASSQRLMQALGAFGYLGVVMGKKQFLKHIPSGLAGLIEASGQAGLLQLRSVALRCRKK